MTTRLQTQRFSTTNQRPATTTRPSGEVWLNFPDLKLGMINPSQAAVDLLAVRNYAPSASYAGGDYAVASGQLQRAKAPITPHAYNAGEWDLIPTQTYTDATYTTQAQNDARYLQLTGGTLLGPLTLANDPWLDLQPATKHYVDINVATRLPLSGGTLTGPLILAADPGTALGAATKQYVDNRVATRLPLTGGTLSGTLNVANGRIVSYNAGNNPSFTVWDTNQGYAAGMFIGGGAALYFGTMDGAGNYAGTWFGYFDTGSNFHVSNNIYAGNDIHAPHFYADSTLGINYSALSGHWIGFGWNGNLNLYVDGGYQFDIASTNWVNSNFATYGWVNGQGYATYSWVNGNFYNTGTSDGRYLYKSGDTSPGTLQAANLLATQDVTANRDVHCAHIFTHSVSNSAFAFYYYSPAVAVFIRVDSGSDFGPINYASDERLKQDIAAADFDCLAAVNRLTLRRFRWRGFDPATVTFSPAADDAPTVRVGLVAQEVAEVLPEAVPDVTPPPGSQILFRTIDPLVMLALLTGAVQQLAKEVRR
jgi:hypothetical protein